MEKVTNDIEYMQSVADDDDDADLLRCINATNPERFVRLLCPKCGEQFADAPSWRCHLEDVHFYNNLKMLHIKATQDGNQFQCKDCGQLFGRTEYRLILDHCFTHMPYSNYFKCRICDQTVNEKKLLKQHIKRHYELHVIRAKTENKTKLDSGFKLEKNQPTNYEQYLNFCCPICLCSVSNAQLWLAHVCGDHDLCFEASRKFHIIPNEQQTDEYFRHAVCKDCGLQLHYNDVDCQLKHLLTHLRFRSFRCAICNLSMNYKGEIKLHMRWLHAEKPANNAFHSMNIDDDADDNARGRVWLTKEKIRIASKYSDYLLYFCPSCNVELHDYHDWSEHIIKNHDFFRPRYLAMHYSVLENGKLLQCLICDRQMSLYCNAFMRHYLKHMPYASHCCAICLQKSTNIYAMIKHLNSKHRTEDGKISELWYFPSKPTKLCKRRKFNLC